MLRSISTLQAAGNRAWQVTPKTGGSPSQARKAAACRGELTIRNTVSPGKRRTRPMVLMLAAVYEQMRETTSRKCNCRSTSQKWPCMYYSYSTTQTPSPVSTDWTISAIFQRLCFMPSCVSSTPYISTSAIVDPGCPAKQDLAVLSLGSWLHFSVFLFLANRASLPACRGYSQRLAVGWYGDTHLLLPV